MAKRQLINGKAYDWSDVTINVDGLENMEVQEISYDDGEEDEVIYGKGGKGRGYGTGNYSATVKLTLLREDYNELCRFLKQKGARFFRYVIPKITVSFANEDSGITTDVLNKVKFNKRSFKSAQGDKSNTVSIDGTVIKGITSNGLDS